MVDDDSFLEWETRHESFPLHKHIVAGKLIFQNKQHFYYLYKITLSVLSIGSCAGIMEHVGMFPLDTVKVS
jgi:hypothetical protein